MLFNPAAHIDSTNIPLYIDEQNRDPWSERQISERVVVLIYNVYQQLQPTLLVSMALVTNGV